MPSEQALEGLLGEGAHGAERGVRLVHVAVGGDPQVVLGDARAAEEARLAEVAGPGVDLHGLSPWSSKDVTTVAGAPPASTAVPAAKWLRWT